jgi:hypothetical protein
MAQKSLTRTKVAERSPDEAFAGGLTRAQLIEFYRLMYLSRRTDDREILLKRQQKIFFQISCAGTRGPAGRRGHGAEAGLRLVLSPIIATALSAWRWATRLRSNSFSPSGAADDTCQRRPADAFALDEQAAEHRLAFVGDGDAVPARHRLRGSRPVSSRGIPDAAKKHEERLSRLQRRSLPRRRGHLRLDRRRIDQPGRVLGVPEHGFEPASCPCFTWWRTTAMPSPPR